MAFSQDYLEPRGNVNAGISELIAACIVTALGSAHAGYTKGVRNGAFLRHGILERYAPGAYIRMLVAIAPGQICVPKKSADDFQKKDFPTWTLRNYNVGPTKN